jgi:hypothetical protein
VSSLLSTGTAFGADAIGDLGVPDGNGGFTLNEAGRHVLHALLGCASGAVQAGSEGCAAGGAGAVLGELGAGWFNPDGTRSQTETLAFAQLMGSLGGALATGNAEGVGIGGTAGGNAAEHNYLNHRRPNMLRLSEVEQYERAARECAGGDASACGRRDALADLSRQRDRELQSACAGATPTLCNSKMAEARSMGNAVHGSDVGANGQLVWANSPKAGFALNVATVGEVQAPTALRQNFHVQLAQSTSQGVFLLLPGPEDVVVGALLLTAPGKVLAEVVFEGGHKLLRFADGATARMGSEEAKLLAQARIDNNFYAEGASTYPVGLTTSAGIIPPNPNKTTTVLGRYQPDMQSAIEVQMVAPKSTNFGSGPGGFNVLNVPDDLVRSAGEQFFEIVNKPFLDEAIRRGDDIALATIPRSKEELVGSSGQLKGAFAKEMQYLASIDYKPFNVTNEQWGVMKEWFK